MKMLISVCLTAGLLFSSCNRETKLTVPDEICGDGIIQEANGEECDGADLNAHTCVSLGFSRQGGTPGCTDQCQLNTETCMPKNADANLDGLTVSAGFLKPAFSSEIISYSVTVSFLVSQLTVGAVPVDIYANIAIEPTQPMALEVGANPVTITVTAEDGTQKAYSVLITRRPDNLQSPNVGTLIHLPSGLFQRDMYSTNLSHQTAIWMSQFEITRGQWTAVSGWTSPVQPSFSAETNIPVVNVNWYHAISFCNKLSLLEGLEPVYLVDGVDFSTIYSVPTSQDDSWDAVTLNLNANGYRLPTEMEWMWAAMGADYNNIGEINRLGYTKSFAGDNGGFIGNYVVFGYYAPEEPGHTTNEGANPVGTRLPNELGFFDLSGNVAEWMWDWYDLYPSGTLTDYQGPSWGPRRVVRGCGWAEYPRFCSVSERSIRYSWIGGNDMGFRVVRR